MCFHLLHIFNKKLKKIDHKHLFMLYIQCVLLEFTYRLQSTFFFLIIQQLKWVKIIRYQFIRFKTLIFI